MSLSKSAESSRRSDDRPFSPLLAERLGGLLAGLDMLDPILSLPIHPKTTTPALAFGRFRLRARLGAGRFGVVLLADDPSLGRQVVVKVPQPAVLADSSLRERFVREARAAARLDHPGVVSVLEAGEVDGLPYLAAAFVPGPTLREWRMQHPGPLPAVTAARFANAVATAVHHAHERGVLHCDLSPSNVLLQPVAAESDKVSAYSVRGLTPTGSPENVAAETDKLSAYAPLVTDFGLARLVDDDPALTQTFQVVGTPLYMAPEQARGDRRNLTARTDVYALGVMLYDLLVGDPPFRGATSTVLAQVETAVPDPPRRRVPNVPRDLNAICLKCLEKNPQDRYSSARELAEDLNRFLIGYPVAARSVSPLLRAARWAARNPVAACLVAITVAMTATAIGVAADRWAKEVQTRADLGVKAAENTAATARAEASEVRAKTAEFYGTLERLRQRRLARPAGWVAANRTDLTRVSTGVAGPNAAAIRTEAAAVAAAIDLDPPRAVVIGFHAHDVAFDPNGSLLAVGGFSADEAGVVLVRLLNPATGEDVRQLQFPADRSWELRGGGRVDGCWTILFSTDGGRVVVGTRSGWLVIWELNRPEPAPIARWRHSSPTTDGPETAKLERITQLAFDGSGRLWSGDDRTAAAWDSAREWAESERQLGFVSLPVAGNVPQQVVVRDSFNASHPAPHTYVRRKPEDELVISLWDHHTVGRLVLPDDNRADDNTITDLVVSPDGLTVAAAAEHAGHLKLWDFTGGRLLASRSLAPGTLRIAIRPDGRELAAVEGDRVQLFKITYPVISDVIGLGPCPIDDADLTPDGRLLATAAAIPNSAGTYLVEMHDLTRQPLQGSLFRMSTASPAGNSRFRLAVAPDGRQLVVHSMTDFRRFAVPDGTREDFGHPQTTRDIRFTPDGKLWAVGGDSVFSWTDGTEKIVPVGGTVTSLASGNDYSLVGRSDGVLARFSATGDLLRTDRLATAAITGLARDRDRIIAGTSTGDVLIIDSDGRPQTISQAHADVVWAIAMGPRGWFATGSGDRDVRIWDSSGQPILTLPQNRPVRRLFWSADGRTLTILAEGERGVRRWHLEALKSEFAAIGLDHGLP